MLGGLKKSIILKGIKIEYYGIKSEKDECWVQKGSKLATNGIKIGNQGDTKVYQRDQN